MKIILEIENTSQDVEQASAVMALLQERFAAPSARVVRTATRTAVHVSAWLTRLGMASRSFWKRAAICARTHREWTFEELSTDDADKRRLRSYHRNSYRAIKAVGAASPLEGHWDYRDGAGNQVYSMSDEVRDAILTFFEENE